MFHIRLGSVFSPCPTMSYRPTKTRFQQVWKPFPKQFILFTTLRNKPFKTLWEKEKMLVTSIFSVSNNLSYPSKNKCPFLSQIYFVICKSSKASPKFCCMVKSSVLDLTLYEFYHFSQLQFILCKCYNFGLI